MKKEDSRLEEFRQLRNEIRGSEKHLLVGIDIGKEKQNAFLGTAIHKAIRKTSGGIGKKEDSTKAMAKSTQIP